MFKYSVQTPQGKKILTECGRASCACFDKYVYTRKLPMIKYLDYKDCKRQFEYDIGAKRDPMFPFLL